MRLITNSFVATFGRVIYGGMHVDTGTFVDTKVLIAERRQRDFVLHHTSIVIRCGQNVIVPQMVCKRIPAEMLVFVTNRIRVVQFELLFGSFVEFK